MSKAMKEGIFNGVAILLVLLPIASAFGYAFFNVVLWVPVEPGTPRDLLILMFHALSFGAGAAYLGGMAT